MKGIVFLIFVFVCSLVGFAQTKSDSLYNTKLYPLENGRFMLIGSEKPGSFRKTVIRLYDEDLKILKQVNMRNIRNSDVFLDENLPNSYRVIYKYRWNKGRVSLFSKDMDVLSTKFFKRDAYKDWKNVSDEPTGYPLKKEEHLFGRNPVFLSDSSAYFFDKDRMKIYVSKHDYSNIKPVYIVYKELDCSAKGEILNYQFKSFADGSVIFLYTILTEQKVNNYFCLLNKYNDKDSFLGMNFEETEKSKNYFVSDFTYDPTAKKIFYGGSFQEKEVVDVKMGKGMDGNFIRVYQFPVKPGEIVEYTSMNHANDSMDSVSIIGYRITDLQIENNYFNAFFEKFAMTERKVNQENLAGSYWTYETQSLIYYRNFLPDNEITGGTIDLLYNLSKENDLKDKQWRTFHNKKGQSILQLVFNNHLSETYNNTSIDLVCKFGLKTIYSDRNKNQYLLELPNHIPKYSLLYKNTEKAKCYFFEDYYVKFFSTDWGFKLEKMKY